MSLREMPERFSCEVCEQVLGLEAICSEHSAPGRCLTCRRCCPCATHPQDDPGGTVVLDFRARHPWRGLDGSAWRTRRQP